MADGEKRAGPVVAAIAGLLLLYAVLRVLAPFVPVLGAAGIIAVVVHPLHRRLSRLLPASASAAVLSGLVSVALVVPLTAAAWYLAREAARAFPVLRQALDGLAAASSPQAPGWVPEPMRGYVEGVDLRGALLENLQELGGWLGRFARSAVSNAFLVVVDALLFVLCLFAFLRHGARMLARFSAALPLSPEPKGRIFKRARVMIAAIVEGVFAIALLQGALATTGFLVLGIGFPVLLGALCMVFSPIPLVGPAVVWLPVAAKLLFSGQPGKAVLLAAWFALVVGTSDNVIRPVLIGTRARQPAVVVALGALGGVVAFGPSGAFLGPVIMGVALAVADELLREPS